MRRSGFKGLVAAGIVATGIAASTTAVAASDMFLKLSGVQGESQDSKHKNEIDVLSWSWGTSTGLAKTKRGTVPEACIQDLHLVKIVDSASPALITMAVMGQVAPDAVLTVRKSGGDIPNEYFILRMTNVSVSSFQTGGSDFGGQLTEQVTLHFDQLKGEYRPQKPDGSSGPAITFDVSGACP
jgi:type VI secretion system secreted protein Hcp